MGDAEGENAQNMNTLHLSNLEPIIRILYSMKQQEAKVNLFKYFFKKIHRSPFKNREKHPKIKNTQRFCFPNISYKISTISRRWEIFSIFTFLKGGSKI